MENLTAIRKLFRTNSGKGNLRGEGKKEKRGTQHKVTRSYFSGIVERGKKTNRGGKTGWV